jgi:hypothetical protein
MSLVCPLLLVLVGFIPWRQANLFVLCAPYWNRDRILFLVHDSAVFLSFSPRNLLILRGLYDKVPHWVSRLNPTNLLCCLHLIRQGKPDETPD